MTTKELPEGLITYWTRTSDTTHLYSETEKDPVIIAKMDAEEELAYDQNGNKLPYDIEVIPRGENIVETRILVFRDQDALDAYLKHIINL